MPVQTVVLYLIRAILYVSLLIVIVMAWQRVLRHETAYSEITEETDVTYPTLTLCPYKSSSDPDPAYTSFEKMALAIQEAKAKMMGIILRLQPSKAM